MIPTSYALILVAVMAGVNYAIRLLPFAFLRGKETPRFISYLGRVLPYAIMGMLLVYCLREVKLFEGSHGLPELIAILVTAGLHIWKKQILLSLIAGTVCYMVLVQVVF